MRNLDQNEFTQFASQDVADQSSPFMGGEQQMPMQ